MSETSQSCRDQAERNARDAEGTELSNVRDRNLRSEAAWRMLGERIERSEVSRRTAAAVKAARDGESA